MTRCGDVLFFLQQILFPNSIREHDEQPSKLQIGLARIALFLTSRDGTGTLFSIILHAFILAVLSFIMLPKFGDFTGIDLLGDFKIPGVEQTEIIAPPNDAAADDRQQTTEPSETAAAPTVLPETETAPVEPEHAVVDSQPVRTSGGFVAGGGFDSRTPEGRQGAMQGGGSCQAGEDAVERALRWLADHQMHDNGWSLHFADSCRNCSHSGTSLHHRRAAATALALLPFLGAGYTHQTNNPYRDHVDRGLLFLSRDTADGFDGSAIHRDELRMYSHGLAAIALCEAYAMSREQDPASRLGRAAQRSLSIIETAQDPEYGGWNYRPDQPLRGNIRDGGDTSIFAWQLMALKSGKIGGLNVSQSVLYAAQDFLDSVQLEGGRRYNYLPSGRWDNRGMGDSPQSCTAMGLLMRMYLGWKPGDVFLDDGIEQLVRWGPILNEGEVNLFYIYYATLALHHYGGEHWDAWNSEVRELLIRTQSRWGCESGSWHFPDRYGDVGGRLLSTSLAVMILETPYRIMPLYRDIR